MRRAGVGLFLAGVAAFALAGQTPSPMAVLTPIVDNEYVKVSQIDMPVGTVASVSAAAGNPLLIVRLRPVFVAGETGRQVSYLKFEIVNYLTGTNAQSHVLTPGNLAARDIAIELKSQPPVGRFEPDAVVVDPSHNRVLFENVLFRVVEVHFGLGEKGPVVAKRPRVIVLLTNMHAQVEKPGGSPETRDGKVGTIYWSLGGSQATMNLNETVLDNIVVELKGEVIP